MRTCPQNERREIVMYRVIGRYDDGRIEEQEFDSICESKCWILEEVENLSMGYEEHLRIEVEFIDEFQHISYRVSDNRGMKIARFSYIEE